VAKNRLGVKLASSTRAFRKQKIILEKACSVQERSIYLFIFNGLPAGAPPWRPHGQAIRTIRPLAQGGNAVAAQLMAMYPAAAVRAADLIAACRSRLCAMASSRLRQPQTLPPWRLSRIP
jgi:hypothetical protein